MRSALEFFATAQSCRELSVSIDSVCRSLAVWLELAQLVVLRNWKETEARKNDVHLLPTELDETVAKMLLPALGTVLTVFGEKDRSFVELGCGTTPLVRDDSARSHLIGALSSDELKLAGKF